jgi:hypothetical protein
MKNEKLPLPDSLHLNLHIPFEIGQHVTVSKRVLNDCWAARDSKGEVLLYHKCPEPDYLWEGWTGDFISLTYLSDWIERENLLKEVTWENSPQLITITIDR